MLDLAVLKELTAAPGVSGREKPVADVISRKLSSDFEILTDPLGNLIAHLPGTGSKLMLVAHMDEVGLIVQRISPEGFLFVERIGGISLGALPGSRMDLWTENGKLSAQVGILPGHLDNHGAVDLQKMYIDIGANDYQDAVEKGVQIGDVLTWRHDFCLDKNHISSKALDDRLGCFALSSLAHELVKIECSMDLYLAFVVQEETMLSGGLPVINRIQPDIVIGIDGTLTFDTPDTAGKQSNTSLGKGPVLKWMDAIRGKQAAYVPDLSLNQKIREVARENKIPLQHEVLTGLSTAITPIPYQGYGIRTAELSLPIRYHHTPIERADLRDLDDLLELLKEFLVLL